MSWRYDYDVFECGTKKDVTSRCEFYWQYVEEFGKVGYHLDAFGVDRPIGITYRAWARRLHGNAPSGTPYADFYFIRNGKRYHGILYL